MFGIFSSHSRCLNCAYKLVNKCSAHVVSIYRDHRHKRHWRSNLLRHNHNTTVLFCPFLLFILVLSPPTSLSSQPFQSPSCTISRAMSFSSVFCPLRWNLLFFCHFLKMQRKGKNKQKSHSWSMWYEDWENPWGNVPVGRTNLFLTWAVL